MTYSCNDNQNYFIQPGRTTSRVHQPPGGNCSLSLGGWTEEELERIRQRNAAPPVSNAAASDTNGISGAMKELTSTTATITNISGSGEKKIDDKPSSVSKAASENNNNHKTESQTHATAGCGSIFPAPPKNVSSNAFASASTTNSFNVLTDRPTSKVSHPPGGHTSIRLG